MTYKKTKLAANFNLILTILLSVMFVALFIGWYIGLQTAEHSGSDAFGGAILFAVGLQLGPFVLAIGVILSIVTTILFYKDVNVGKRLTGKYILSTLSKAYWVLVYVYMAVLMFDFGYYGIVLGIFAALMALLSVAACVFDWISRKELV